MVKELELAENEFKYECAICKEEHDSYDDALLCEKNCKRGVKENGGKSDNSISC